MGFGGQSPSGRARTPVRRTAGDCRSTYGRGRPSYDGKNPIRRFYAAR